MPTLPGLPSADPLDATRRALEEPLYRLGMEHDPDQVLRAVQRIVLDVRKRWPAERRPHPAGVHHGEKPAPTTYEATPGAIVAAGDALAQLMLMEFAERAGPLQHKSMLLHMMIVQAINASIRASDGISPSGYIYGIANGVAQMLAINDPDTCYAEFMRVLPDVWAHWRKAGMGAGVDMTPKGSV